MNNEYRPDQIETDVQKKWSDTNAFDVTEDAIKEKNKVKINKKI